MNKASSLRSRLAEIPAEPGAPSAQPTLLAGAELVRVAGAGNQVEAEFLQGLLLEHGVPSLLRRAGGSDVPEFLAAGARDLLVPAAQADLAREIVVGVNPQLLASHSSAVDSPKRLAAGLLVAVALAALVICLVIDLGL
jgi:Putative prokaryotic signal transducing protein